MYKVIPIDGKEYHLEYTIEASLYADCISSLTEFMADIEIANSNKDIKKVLAGMSNIPQTALTLFYAGLMEAHGSHEGGDNSVPDKETAKTLIAKYIKENKENGEGNFYSILEMCINQMSEDGFFDLVGLNAMMSQKPKLRKVPQDHKKASGK